MTPVPPSSPVGEIPADIMFLARAVHREGRSLPVLGHEDEVNVIARALLAERERCAKLADRMTRDHKRRIKRVAEAGHPESAIFHDGYATGCKELAASIRGTP